MGLPGQLLTGFVFAIFPFMILCLSPLCNVLANRIGRVALLYLGVPTQVATVILFGLSTRLCSSSTGVIALFLGSRALQGFGAALANLAIFAIVAEHFEHSLGKVMGFNEVIIGVGFMMGPVAGSLLYTAGGFALPFLSAAAVLALSFPFVVVYHEQQKRREKEAAETYKVSERENREMKRPQACERSAAPAPTHLRESFDTLAS